jgi:hypothetical protein
MVKKVIQFFINLLLGFENGYGVYNCVRNSGEIPFLFIEL